MWSSTPTSTCRHFAVLACALLRHRGIPARARCGFATYFQPGKGLDHTSGDGWRRRTGARPAPAMTR
ncbi:transglutaminase-like domain-containing protein [Wangella sp. NEAU-J3]|nr:transglutaminase-like domain-containing protein [Jidongwangia harbinensis]